MPNQLLTPGEIVRKYPEIRERWTPNQLGYLLNCKVIRGKKSSRQSLIEIESLFELLKFLNNK